MTERDTRYFYEVAKCLSFTEAARSLYISQPALSKQIAKLEEELGFPLFQRTKQEVKLTPGGMVLMAECRRLSVAYQEMLERARLANEGKTGELRIGIQEGQSLDEQLLGLVREFRARYQQVELEIECLPYRQLLDQIQRGEIDIGLTLIFSERDMVGMGRQEIKQMPSYVVLSEDHPLAASERLELSDLNSEMLLVVCSELVPQGAQFVLDQCAQCRISPRGVRRVGSYSALYLWLTMGAGFAFMNQNVWYSNKRLHFAPLPKEVGVTQTACWNTANGNPAIPLFLSQIEK